MAKYHIAIVDEGVNQPPHVAFDQEGTHEDGHMGRAIYVLLRMVLELMNSPYRNDLVSMIGTIHQEYRAERAPAKQGSGIIH